MNFVKISIVKLHDKIDLRLMTAIQTEIGLHSFYFGNAGGGVMLMLYPLAEAYAELIKDLILRIRTINTESL